MMCRDIEEILPGLLDGVLGEEEKKRVEEHLSLCPGCRECLSDLKKAVALAGDMEEIEPPARFTQDIMARVRKEASAKKEPGLLRKLFFPLHVKLPLQAFATVCIVVLSFYVYRSVGPEMRVLEDQPARMPDSLQLQENIPHPAAEAPAAVGQEAAKAMPEKAAGPAEKQGKAADAVKAKAKDAGVTGKERKMEYLAPPSPAQEYDASRAEGAAAPLNQTQAAPAPSQPVPVFKKAEAPGKGVSAESSDDALPALEDKAGKAGEGYPRTKSLAESAPGAVLMKSVAAPPSITVTLVVPDLDSGVRAVEKILADLPARVVAREMLKGRVVLVSEIPARQVAAYVEKAGAVGRLEGKADSGPVREGFVRVATVVKTHSE